MTTDTPHRVQLSRRKGWKMPPNTVKVARPGKWGNPYVVGLHGDEEACVMLYRRLVEAFAPQHFAELRGQNLACFCPLGAPCHADVLLEIVAKD